MSTGLSQRASTRLQDPPVSQEQRTQQAKEAFQASLKSTGASVDHELHARAKVIHANAQEIDKQDKKLQKDTKQLAKESDALDKFLAKSRNAMPNTDSFNEDIANLEAELDILDDMLDNVEQRDRQEEDEPTSENAQNSSKTPTVDASKP